VLTGKYLGGIPGDSRVAVGMGNGSMSASRITPQVIATIAALDKLARRRGQTLAQMALAWLLRDGRVTSAVIGASKPEQVAECVAALANTRFDRDELDAIDAILRSMV